MARRRLADCVADCFVSARTRCLSVPPSLVLRRFHSSSHVNRRRKGLETGFLGAAAQSRTIDDLRPASGQLPRSVIDSVSISRRNSN